MKKSRIKPISDKQKDELALRRKLKAELIKRQLDTVGFILCETCGRRPDWRGISLSHKVSLSRGGKTTRENCLLECYPCHEKFEKKPELRAEELKKYWEE